MKVKKYSTGGGPFEISPRTQRRLDRKAKKARKEAEKEAKRNPRRNLAPQNPRFLPSAQMTGTRAPAEPEKEEKEKKPKTKRGGQSRLRRQRPTNRGASYGRGGGRGARTARSCRGGNCP